MPRADWKIVPAGNGPVVTVTVFANSDVEDEDEDEDELDADVLPPDTVDVAVAVLPAFCCGRGQTLILGLGLSNSRTESGSALNGGRMKRIFAFCGDTGCTDTFGDTETGA